MHIPILITCRYTYNAPFCPYSILSPIKSLADLVYYSNLSQLTHPQHELVKIIKVFYIMHNCTILYCTVWLLAP